MIRAINKDGRQRDFTERVWSMMPKHKNGWVEYEAQGEVLVPQQIIEFQQKKKEAAAIEVKTFDFAKDNLSDEAKAKAFLKADKEANEYISKKFIDDNPVLIERSDKYSEPEMDMKVKPPVKRRTKKVKK